MADRDQILKISEFELEPELELVNFSRVRTNSGQPLVIKHFSMVIAPQIAEQIIPNKMVKSVVYYFHDTTRMLHILCNSLSHAPRPFFLSLFPSPFCLLSISFLFPCAACYFEGVESRRGELQNVCNIYFLTVHNIKVAEGTRLEDRHFR